MADLPPRILGLVEPIYRLRWAVGSPGRDPSRSAVLGYQRHASQRPKPRAQARVAPTTAERVADGQEPKSCVLRAKSAASSARPSARNSSAVACTELAFSLS